MEISHERLLKEADLLASQLKFEQQRNLSLQENLNAADSLQRKISEVGWLNRHGKAPNTVSPR